MKRPLPVVLAVGTLALFVWLFVQESSQREAARKVQAEQEREAQYAQTKSEAQENPDEKPAPEQTPDAVPAPPSPPPLGGFELGRERLWRLPDGSAVPPLPQSAPQRVKLGVALFAYQGAEGASQSQAPREQALQNAKKAARVAADDFVQAVKMGDKGSSENIGWIRRSVLESAVQHAVFSLKKGETSPAPVDTPRGFWVVKRLR